MLRVSLLSSVALFGLAAGQDETQGWTASAPAFLQQPNANGKMPDLSKWDQKSLEILSDPEKMNNFMAWQVDQGLKELEKLPGFPSMRPKKGQASKLTPEQKIMLQKRKAEYDVWGNKKSDEQYEADLLLEAKKHSEVVKVTGENFTNLNNGSWFVMVHAPWCEACKRYMPKYDAISWGAQFRLPNVKFGKMDATKNEVESALLGIVAYPAFLFFHEGQVRMYRGNKTQEDVDAYITGGWMDAPVLGYWDNPFSFHMVVLREVVAVGFKVQDQLMELNRNGVSWGVIALVALVMCVVGGIIAAHMLVKFFDLLFGSKKKVAPAAESKTKTKKDQ